MKSIILLYRRSIGLAAAFFAVALPALALPTLAYAEGYEKVPDRDPTTIAANPFIAGAYGFIWVALLVYVVFVARGLQKASAEVKQLRSKLEQS